MLARRLRTRARSLILLAVAVVATAIGLLAYGTDLLRRTEHETVDARFSIRGEKAPPRDIVVVQVDDVTFQELRLQWPFPRSVHADVVRRLTAAGARAIAYDVQFTEPTNPRDDSALATAVAEADRVVLSTTEVNERGEAAVFGPPDVLRRIGARAGNTAIVPDSGGIFRRFPYELDGLESFPVATVEAASGRRVERSKFDGESAWIDFHGPPGTFEPISFSRVAQGRVRPGAFRDKIVVIGASAPSLQDVHATSTTGDDLMSGPEIQANAISTLRRDLPLSDVPGGLNVILIALLGIAAPVASLYLSPIRSLALALGLGLLFAVAVQLAFNAGAIVALVYPLLALVIGSVGAITAHYVLASFERERVKTVFSRFVPEAAVSEVLARTDEDLRLGGVERECTVLFSDIRGFTTFSETRPPNVVVGVLNNYLNEMTEAIMDEGGTLVSYMGDGIMAVFGAPLPQDDHADRALAAAQEMLGPRLSRFNGWMREQGTGLGFQMGVGLNSGTVVSGNIGGLRRMEYTTIGDTVNTASRLEGMTKGTPHSLYMSDSTREALTREPPELVYVDELEVRGREAKIKLWSVSEEPRVAEPSTSAEPAPR